MSQDDWESGHRSPVSPDLSGKLVINMEHVEAIWSVDDDDGDQAMSAPVLILTSFTRDGSAATQVLSLAGMVTLMAIITSALSHLFASNVEAIDSSLLDESLVRLIEEETRKGDDSE